MLIELKFKNYLSFKNETTFLMTAVKSFKEHINDNIIKTQRDFDLLKCAAVYGTNGGGKSNFMTAINVMSKAIFTSYSNSLLKTEDKPLQELQFKLNSKTEKENTLFEASFLINSEIYRYGFEIQGYEIKKEWLFKKSEREVPLFERNNNLFEINKESFSEGLKYKDDVNSNVLFISHLAQNNQPISKLVTNWFSDTNVISGLHEHNYDKFTAKLLEKDENFKIWAASVLKHLEISNIEAGEKDGEIITYHNKYDENNFLIDTIPFSSSMESEGTKKLIHILGPIYDTLRKGKILFIDEFNSKLHTNLSKRLLTFFNSLNKRNAQIIFSGHDTNLLDKTILRRDQIWFIDKDQFGASELYSLSEFNTKAVRNTSAFDKKYLENEFGAADSFDVNHKLIDLLYD